MDNKNKKSQIALAIGVLTSSIRRSCRFVSGRLKYHLIYIYKGLANQGGPGRLSSDVGYG